ncbi:MAG: hypothetical protein LBH99_02470 [Rickettsia sp.]|jgi:hypothetical protein|nr:hypothetical protein [Rickettsia sp.]
MFHIIPPTSKVALNLSLGLKLKILIQDWLEYSEKCILEAADTNAF